MQLMRYDTEKKDRRYIGGSENRDMAYRGRERTRKENEPPDISLPVQNVS